MGEAPAVSPEATHRVGSYDLSVATGFGPRLTLLRHADGPNVFVRLGPEVTLEAGQLGVFRFRGGHRLWASPEVPEVTYAPDDHECAVSYQEGVLRAEGAVDTAGFRKRLEVWADGDQLVVDHRLTWVGDSPIMAAAWAISQVPTGGTALLPLGRSEGGSVRQADRSLVLWPYTDPTDPRVYLQAGLAVVEALPGPALKLGAGPAPRRLGYLRDGWLFTKTVPAATANRYPDRGAVGQVYTNGRFCELESVGPLVSLAPGSSVDHQERWRVTRCPNVESAVELVLE